MEIKNVAPGLSIEENPPRFAQNNGLETVKKVKKHAIWLTLYKVSIKLSAARKKVQLTFYSEMACKIGKRILLTFYWTSQSKSVKLGMENEL